MSALLKILSGDETRSVGRTKFLLTGLLWISLLPALWSPQARAASDEGVAADRRHHQTAFQPMFDGRSLEGWRVTPAAAAPAWSVNNGVLTGQGTHGRCYLEWTGNTRVADFELQLQYRLPGKGNSGINIRAVADPTGRRAWQAYHADFGHVGIGPHILGAWDFHTPGRTEHGVPRGKRLVIDEQDKATWTTLPAAPVITPDAEGWNRVRIVARGRKLEYYLNGRLSAAFEERLPAERCLQSGRIQLQVHDPDMTVEFRELQIRVFD